MNKKEKYRTIEEWGEAHKEEIDVLTSGKYSLVEYGGSKLPAKFLHLICGNTFETALSNFRRVVFCRACGDGDNGITERGIKEKQKTFVKYKEILKEKEMSLLEYNGFGSKATIKFDKCGHETKRVLSMFLQSYMECQICRTLNGSKSLEARFIEKYAKRIKERYYEYLGGYKTSKNPILLKCLKCEREYEVQAGNFCRLEIDCPCRIKSGSKGEEGISEILNKLGLNFFKQYTFEDCRSVRPLPFDFAVLDDQEGNLKIRFLIEYDGPQHYEPIKLFGGEKYFNKLKANDATKTAYCEDNNIPLLRIPYTKFSKIEEILSEWLHIC